MMGDRVERRGEKAREAGWLDLEQAGPALLDTACLPDAERKIDNTRPAFFSISTEDFTISPTL